MRWVFLLGVTEIPSLYELDSDIILRGLAICEIFYSISPLTEAILGKFLPAAIVRRFGSQLLEVHQRKEKTEQLLEQLDRPLSPSQGARLKVLRDLAREVANSLGLAPELLARKKDVEACLRHFNATGELSEIYFGWRKEVVGKGFLQVLEAAV